MMRMPPGTVAANGSESAQHRVTTGTPKQRREQEVARRVAENSQLDARLQVALATSGFGIWEHDHERGSSQWSSTTSGKNSK